MRAPFSALLLLASCAAPENSAVEAPVREVLDRLIAADNLLDLDRALDCYGADAVLVPPGGAEVRGKESIRARYASQFEAWRPELRVVHEETLVGPGEARDRGRTHGQLHSTSGIADKDVDDVYEAMLRLEDGTWRISELKWQPRKAQARQAR